MASVNKVTLIGNLGADPKIRNMQNGDPVANLSVATSETWKDKQSGEKREKTEWHLVVVFGGLAKICEKYLHKGSKVYLSGKLQTRKWQDQAGVDKYTTEIVLQGFGAEMVMLDSKQGGDSAQSGSYGASDYSAAKNGEAGERSVGQELDDEIPF